MDVQYDCFTDVYSKEHRHLTESSTCICIYVYFHVALIWPPWLTAIQI